LKKKELKKKIEVEQEKELKLKIEQEQKKEIYRAEIKFLEESEAVSNELKTIFSY